MKIRYNKKLTIKENSIQNNCSTTTIKNYIKKLNLSPSKARTRLIADNICKVRDSIIEEGKKATIKSVCELSGYSNKTVIKYLNNGVQKGMTKSTPKSYSYKQTEILSNIMQLYNKGESVQCDLTFSAGKMWKNLIEPSFKFDLKPQHVDIKPLSEAEQYVNYFDSIVFDLPFVIRPASTDNSIIVNRFDAFESEKELLEVNSNMLQLAYNILKYKGICVIKTQDTSYSERQIFTHHFLMNECVKVGFKIEYIFVLLNKNAIIKSDYIAKHARKCHSYFIVLRK